MSRKRKTSTIWMHFVEDGAQRAKCKYCKASLSIAGGSQGNLNRHLKGKHPLIPMVLNRQTLSMNLPTVNSPTINLFTDAAETEEHSTSTQMQILSQPQLSTQSIAQIKHRPPPLRKVQQLDRKVLKFEAKGCHALRTVEEPEFKKLVEVVSHCSDYRLPTRKKLAKNLMPSVHNKILNDIKVKMQSATAVCLTTERWTSRTNIGYLAVTAHYIDDDTKLQSHLIASGAYGDGHGAENLCNYIQKIATDFDIISKINAVVSDNASNIAAAITKGGWHVIGCFAHTLNLIMQEALDVVAETVAKIKRIVEYFHRSSQGFRKLYEIQKQMQLPELKLKQDVATSWSSTYEMLESVVFLKDAIITTLSLVRPDLALSLEEWEHINEIIPILKPFYEVTVEISENNVTLSKVTVLCNLMEKYILKCVSKKNKIVWMIQIIQKELNFRFGDYENNLLYAESTILDPRFKKRGFKNEVSYQDAVKNLRQRLVNIRLSVDNAAWEPDEHQPNPNSTEHSIWNDYDKDFYKTKSIREFDKYLNEESLERKKDPLLWWQERKTLYPRVYTYALKRLCIVATCV